MEDFQVSKFFTVKSYKKNYKVVFDNHGIEKINDTLSPYHFYIIDKKIAELYVNELKDILGSKNLIIIEAKEENKVLEKIPEYILKLSQMGIRRDCQLVAIGGGIIQDITCFISSILMRGIRWVFYPTTLLAQSDSCIGSKSSINLINVKNLVGTFNPPDEIIIDINFLNTLDNVDIFSGIGEMLKVHAIKGKESFERISKHYSNIIQNPQVMSEFIRDSLLIKKEIIELDEFDENLRNVMNYGHSFGHAIESATNFSIPHGIAVTIGMDLANYVAYELNVTSKETFLRMHEVFKINFSAYRQTIISPLDIFASLKKDKKNTTNKLKLILPNKQDEIKIGLYDNLKAIEKNIGKYLTDYFAI